MKIPVVTVEGVVHGVVRDGSMTFCGLAVPEAHLRDMLISGTRNCSACYQFDNAEPVDDDPAF